MLTKRLAACAALVTPGGVVCDVGTDHAYLPAELLRRGQCTRAVATDIHAGPLEAAKRTLTEAGVLEQAELFLCDGLAQVQPEGITDVVIAGMGGETIIHILEDCPWRRQVHLILQPMTKIPDLRRWLAEQGFSWTEQAVQEGEKFYVVLSVFHSGTPGILSLLEQEVGCLDCSLRPHAAMPAGNSSVFRNWHSGCGRHSARRRSSGRRWRKPYRKNCRKRTGKEKHHADGKRGL